MEIESSVGLPSMDAGVGFGRDDYKDILFHLYFTLDELRRVIKAGGNVGPNDGLCYELFPHLLKLC